MHSVYMSSTPKSAGPTRQIITHSLSSIGDTPGCKQQADDEQTTMTTEEPIDDIWGGDSDDEPCASADIAKLRRIHNKQGYLDGISRAKESTLQSGFDSGYPEGAQLAIEVGKILGGLQLLASLPAQDPRSEAARQLLSRAKVELHISRVLSWRYFNEDLTLPQDGHRLIVQWKHRVDQLYNSI